MWLQEGYHSIKRKQTFRFRIVIAIRLFQQITGVFLNVHNLTIKLSVYFCRRNLQKFSFFESISFVVKQNVSFVIMLTRKGFEGSPGQHICQLQAFFLGEKEMSERTDNVWFRKWAVLLIRSFNLFLFTLICEGNSVKNCYVIFFVKALKMLRQYKPKP